MRVRELAGATLLLLIAGCNQMPGTPKPGVEVPRPDSITDFATLYGQNCAGCHGKDGQDGAALDLANPVYQAWVDDAAIRKVIAGSEPGTQMPAFGQAAGGFLTAAQVDALVHGMRSAWQKPGTLSGQTPPPYQPVTQGDATRGQAVYQAACARCHEQPGRKITVPLFWRSSMTRRFAQSSSQGAQIWVILTGERVWMITLSPTTRLPTP